MVLQKFDGKVPFLLFWAGSRKTRGKIPLNGELSRLYYCVMDHYRRGPRTGG